MILLESTEVFLEESAPAAVTTESLVFGSTVTAATDTGASSFGVSA